MKLNPRLFSCAALFSAALSLPAQSIREISFTTATPAVLDVTDREHAPWWSINSDDKRAARLNTISHLLGQVPYDRLDPDEVPWSL